MPQIIPELKIRQKIMVARKGERQWYSSAIQDIKDGELYIEIPRQRERVLVLQLGEEIDVRFTGENASFFFTTRCLGKTTDSIPLVCLAPPENIKRIQQRQHVRIPAALEVLYALPTEKNQQPKYKKAITVDISAGGMRLAVNEPLDEGTILNLEFSLPLKKGPKKISTTGRVLRQGAVEAEGKTVYPTAIEFNEITRTEQDYIVNFVFTKTVERIHLR